MIGMDASEWRLPERRNQPYDEPDALALVGAVRAYLRDELLDRVEGPDRWLVRVAANALAIAEREVRLGAGHRAAHGERLAELGVSSDRELAEAIRSGAFDDRWDEVLGSVRASVADSMAVANPDYGVS